MRLVGARMAAVAAGLGLMFCGQTDVRDLGNDECESTYRRPPVRRHAPVTFNLSQLELGILWAEA